MIQEPETHILKNDGGTADIFREAFNQQNKAEYYKCIASELMGLLKKAQNVVVINPASGPLSSDIAQAISNYESKL